MRKMINKKELFIEKMKQEGLAPLVIDTFISYYSDLSKGCSGIIPEQQISPLERDELDELRSLNRYESVGEKVLNKAVILKLNGGLGTTMGLNRAKSLIGVKNGSTFLDITALQIRALNKKHSLSVPLLLMNSFKTDADSLKALESYSDISTSFPLSFLQNKFPKVLQSTLKPACYSENPALEWNPPGHGDIFTSLATSGILDKLIESGYHYAFISNIDNLGASLDTNILGYFHENKFPFLMEVTERTFMDRKGGHLAKTKDGQLILRESAQCPKEDTLKFSDTNLHKFFNTNNLWLNLPALKQQLKKDKQIKLPMIANSKHLNPRDKTTPLVYQLESAMGSAISIFENSAALRVPRSRFAPVKSCEDLLLLWSDYYDVTEESKIVVNPARGPGNPSITLDPLYYAQVDQLQQRFPYGAPSLIDCNSFKINGDVVFGNNVKIVGDITITNSTSETLIIQDNTTLDSNIIK
ncbi:UTP--glucose-1-phosphate uridylyltransferase [Chitinispirillum alkaliphilum]|nr:UTP--glucose-1-phosphate uridylyltransferase [Chitinispirillum alkaliphilum]